MLERMRLAARSLLTMSNLFENLDGLYGDCEAFRLAEPLGYRLFPSPSLTHRDCLLFTNLAAEAIIRDLDLKKGERVLVVIPDMAELMLVVAALIKAGGIAVPLGCRLPQGEIRGLAEACGVSLAVVDGRVLGERADLLQGMAEKVRVMATGPRSLVPLDTPSLDEAMDRSSGFFLPYTLKPSNVVGLFHAEMGEGPLKAVMVTSEGLLAPRLAAAWLFPCRPGDLCLHAMSLGTVDGLCAAVLGLCMGMRMLFMPEEEMERIVDALEEHKPSVFMAAPDTYRALLRAGAPGRDLLSVRLWFSAGDPLSRPVKQGFRGIPVPWRGRAGAPAAFVEAYGAGGNAPMIALKPDLYLPALPGVCPGLAVPPNRMKVVDGSGQRVGGGGEGKLYIRGPAVTPGYWNDIKGTLEAKRNGWFNTGIAAVKHRLLITLR